MVISPGILPYALRASLRPFKIAPGDFVAPNSRYRGRVTKAKRCTGGRHCTREGPEEPTPAERRASMSWAQRLKRVFGIDVETCPARAGAVRIIASRTLWHDVARQ